MATRTAPARTIACVMLAALAIASSIESRAADVPIYADTATIAKRQGVVEAGKVAWRCQGSRCVGITGATPPMSLCTALAREVGALRAFAKFSPGEVSSCNTAAGLGSAASAPIAPAFQAQKPQAPSVLAKPASPPPASKPAVAADKPFEPARIRTATLQVTGTGAAAAIGASFTPVRLRTAPLALTGTGSAAAIGATFAPVAIRTAPLRITGSGTH